MSAFGFHFGALGYGGLCISIVLQTLRREVQLNGFGVARLEVIEMGKNERTITSAKVTITLELFDLGTFGPGSLIEQAKRAAASQLSVILATVVDPSQVVVESVSTADGVATGKIEAIRS